MTAPTPPDVDRYLEGCYLAPDPVLDHALGAAASGGLPAIQVSALQGKFLMLLARMAGARRILEIGTLGGYSTTWLARALPADGALVTLELDPHHAEVARGVLSHAGMAHQCTVRVGPALASLQAMATEGTPPFDFVFIDADKPGYVAYLDAALPLVRAGAVIVADNVVRRGAVVDPASSDANVQGARAFNAAFGGHPRIEATALQVVGAKGHDGIAIGVVRG
jgi:predicted O-methyltransferase YrrM